MPGLAFPPPVSLPVPPWPYYYGAFSKTWPVKAKLIENAKAWTWSSCLTALSLQSSGNVHILQISWRQPLLQWPSTLYLGCASFLCYRKGSSRGKKAAFPTALCTFANPEPAECIKSNAPENTFNFCPTNNFMTAFPSSGTQFSEP